MGQKADPGKNFLRKRQEGPEVALREGLWLMPPFPAGHCFGRLARPDREGQDAELSWAWEAVRWAAERSRGRRSGGTSSSHLSIDIVLRASHSSRK